MSILNKITKNKKADKIKEVKSESVGAEVTHKKNRLTADKIGFIIEEPVITEKTSEMAPLGKYVFKVALKATKNEVKKAVESLYNVNVTGVNILRTAVKPRRIGRNIVTKGAFKKAIVSVKAGESIDPIKS